MHNYIINFNCALNKNTAFLNSCNNFEHIIIHLLFVAYIHINDFISNSRKPGGDLLPDH